jgi:hypothetical protein
VGKDRDGGSSPTRGRRYGLQGRDLPNHPRPRDLYEGRVRRVQHLRSGHSGIADRADVDEVEGAIGAEFRIHGAVDAIRPDDECLPAGLPGLRIDVLDEDAQAIS